MDTVDGKTILDEKGDVGMSGGEIVLQPASRGARAVVAALYRGDTCFIQTVLKTQPLYVDV